MLRVYSCAPSVEYPLRVTTILNLSQSINLELIFKWYDGKQKVKERK